MKIKLSIIFLTIVVVFTASCSKIDTIGHYSVRSFNEILTNAPQLVTPDEANNGWSLAAPDSSARFIWSSNFDMMVEFDAIPFIAAGLDPASLPSHFSFDGEQNLLITGAKLRTEQLRYKGEATPLASYEQIVRHRPLAVGYHSAGGHYGVELGNGNMFEWAGDLAANNNDIVFVLDPEPFIAAGTDTDSIEGWALTKVSVHGGGGGTNMVQVDKLLKRFDLP